MKYVLFGAAVLVLVVGFLFAGSYYKDRKVEQLGFMAKDNATTFVREHSQTLGSDDAKVYIVEFTDPACETCAAFSKFIKQMMAANPGKIKLVIRYAPFHDGADYFVTILEAAKKQDKYWETLDVMFRSQPYWASHSDPQPQRVWQFLPMAGVDVELIKKDMNDPAIAKLIQQDLADAKTLGVRKTPGFFVNGKPLQEFGYQQLLDLVQSELNANYPDSAVDMK
jgi:protein-disulfide isomerase